MGRLGNKQMEQREGMRGMRGRKRGRNTGRSGGIEELIKVLKRDAKKAFPEQKEGGIRND